MYNDFNTKTNEHFSAHFCNQLVVINQQHTCLALQAKNLHSLCTDLLPISLIVSEYCHAPNLLSINLERMHSPTLLQTIQHCT